MRAVNAPRDRGEQARDTRLARVHLGTRERTRLRSLRQRVIAHVILQAAALDEAHAVVVHAFMLANLEDRHDVRMIEVGGRFGFGSETPDHRARRQRTANDGLERDDAIEADLSGPENDPHPSGRDLLQQLIVPQSTDLPRAVERAAVLSADRCRKSRNRRRQELEKVTSVLVRSGRTSTSRRTSASPAVAFSTNESRSVPSRSSCNQEDVGRLVPALRVHQRRVLTADCGNTENPNRFRRSRIADVAMIAEHRPAGRGVQFADVLQVPAGAGKPSRAAR